MTDGAAHRTSDPHSDFQHFFSVHIKLLVYFGYWRTDNAREFGAMVILVLFGVKWEIIFALPLERWKSKILAEWRKKALLLSAFFFKLTVWEALNIPNSVGFLLWFFSLMKELFAHRSHGVYVTGKTQTGHKYFLKSISKPEAKGSVCYLLLLGVCTLSLKINTSELKNPNKWKPGVFWILCWSPLTAIVPNVVEQVAEQC